MKDVCKVGEASRGPLGIFSQTYQTTKVWIYTFAVIFDYLSQAALCSWSAPAVLVLAVDLFNHQILLSILSPEAGGSCPYPLFLSPSHHCRRCDSKDPTSGDTLFQSLLKQRSKFSAEPPISMTAFQIHRFEVRNFSWAIIEH